MLPYKPFLPMYITKITNNIQFIENNFNWIHQYQIPTYQSIVFNQGCCYNSNNTHCDIIPLPTLFLSLNMFTRHFLKNTKNGEIMLDKTGIQSLNAKTINALLHDPQAHHLARYIKLLWPPPSNLDDFTSTYYQEHIVQ